MYNPDKWIIVKLPKGAKVLGSWSGGYLDGDSWQQPLVTYIKKGKK